MLTKVIDVIFQCLWCHSCLCKVHKYFWCAIVPSALKKVPQPHPSHQNMQSCPL